ncbi:MAG TPA: protein kinase, partial [Gemmatimonadaceae bacterium]|nr:protein kinase [Gemmatimonadaceae bacterium]
MTQAHSSDWWRRVLDAADRALELAPEARAGFVDQCANEEPALAAELRALLTSADATSSLDMDIAEFAAPIVERLEHDGQSPERPQAMFGAYRIVRELGRGGMGAVYLAERSDRQFEKLVALKVLPPWSAGDARRMQRFLDERQILAALDHPDIARLVDGGITPEGLPWFAMEFVDGLPIDRYCDERSLSIDGRLELFCRVCEAVQYAHRNLVVHRDLKPANILVAQDGRVRLLDFGIAKLLGDAAAAELTMTGEQILTPLYASPEQLRGAPVSTATDVYALGVLLHVLLTGRYPYQLSSWGNHEVARAVLEQDAVRPSLSVARTVTAPRGDGATTPERIASRRDATPARLERRLRGDVDAIVLKAIEKEPSRRYATAEQLEADVRRHLSGLPVTARVGSRSYHARKFLRRHRIAVGAAVGVTSLVLAFSGVAVVQAARIRAQALRITSERDKAVRVVGFLDGLFKTTTRSTSDRGVTARDYLDSAAARVDQRRVPDPDRRAQLMVAMARAYVVLSLPAQARALAESSLALLRPLRPRRDADIADGSRVLGDALLAQGETGAAELAYAEATALNHKAGSTRRADEARALVGLAAVRRAQRRLAEAESLARAAISIDRARGDEGRVDLAQSTSALAHARLDAGDFSGAARLFEDALSLARQTHPEEHVDVAGAVFALATALKSAGDNARGDSLLRYGETLYQRLVSAALLGAGARDGGGTNAGATSVTRAFDEAMAAPTQREASAKSAAPTPTQQGNADDSRILFVSDRDGPDAVGDLGTTEIYAMKPDGADQRRLTHAGGIQSQAVSSPDGERIAYTYRANGGMDIFAMNADGTGQRRITNLTEAGLAACRPTWSPDGRRIAFQSWAKPDIYIVNADGSGLTKITDHPAADMDAAWSPDGHRIAFNSARDGNTEIYTVDPNGKNLTRLTFNDAKDQHPAWSPDGRRIAFHSDRDGDPEIYVMNADGTNPVRLTQSPGEDAHPAWSPDGRRIVFHRRVLGHTQIYVMNADGS